MTMKSLTRAIMRVPHLLPAGFRETFLAFLLLLLSAPAWAVPGAPKSGELPIIPRPMQQTVLPGTWTVKDNGRILLVGEDLWEEAHYLRDLIFLACGSAFEPMPTPKAEPFPNSITLAIDSTLDSLGAEGYVLTIGQQGAVISSMAPAGIFYGIQSLYQLFPPESETSMPRAVPRDVKVQCGRVIDRPRFGWRGMLLDCCRHFMDKNFVKRYIDLLARHKMNRFHWHLTEDQGWRIEIRKYPELSRKGAFRHTEDGTAHGGFYTQDEIREIVEYARIRHVEVIPEIEMPGHCSAALATFPELSCTGKPMEVPTTWGVFKDVYCAGNDKTFEFLENVLLEVADLFPSRYIHIGGDEVPKDRWKACPRCRQRIKSEGLKDEAELQSWFIRRIAKFLQVRDKRIIGWDEILEGGLAENAVVQSWRGMDGARAAVMAGHDAIVSPTSHAYFDYSLATTDLAKVYSFEPVPGGLPPAAAKHILGGECNMWTEYAPQELVDSKVFPRLLAMSEVLWSPAGSRDMRSFRARLDRHYVRLDTLGVQYGFEAEPVRFRSTLDKKKSAFSVRLEAGQPGLKLHYTTNGSEPDTKSPVYSEPFRIKDAASIRVVAVDRRGFRSEPAQQEYSIHAGIYSRVTLSRPPSASYTGGGDSALVDGMRGSVNHHDGRWQGFEFDDVTATIDLGAPKTIRSVGVGFLQNPQASIYFPWRVEIAVSADGKRYRTAGEAPMEPGMEEQQADIRRVALDLPQEPVRYLRIEMKNAVSSPAWQPRGQQNPWLFIDEIEVR